MENKEPKAPVEQGAEEAQDIISRAKANSKLLIGVSVFVLVVIVAILVWFMVAKDHSAKADEAIGKADVEQNDSIALNLYKDAATHGYKSGNRAKIEVAMRLYQDGKYEEALEYLKDASVDSDIVESGVLTLEGDCYVNLKQYDAALSCYQKAVSAADKNPSIVPIVLVKEANVYREQQNYEEEARAYKTILDDYPQFTQMSSADVRKFYERAKDQAAQ